MTNEVLKLSGNYRIATADKGTITLDTGVTTGTVIITGNLDVKGTQTFIESVDSKIKDNILILNQGETNGYVSLNTSGIQIDRGNNASSTSSAFMVWDDTVNWSAGGPSIRGLWDFKKGPNLAAIRISAIQFDGNGPNLDGRLNLLGQGVAGMLSVAGQTNYSSRVVDPDDIPNKEYVDNRPFTGLATFATTATSVLGTDNDTRIVINDDSTTFQESNITAYVNTAAVFVLRPNSAVIGGLRFTNAQIESITTNTDLILKTNGTGLVVAQNGVAFQSPVFPTWSPPVPEIGKTKVYSTSTTGAGSTGLLYNHTDGVNTVYGELVSARKALIFGMIF